MKIVVTGAAGFIGSHTCEALVARGHQVVAVDAFDGLLYPAAVKRRCAEELTARTGLAVLEHDLLDVPAMRAMIDPSVDVVCHLAALPGVRPSLAEPARYIRVNVEGTTNLLEAMRAAGRNRMVFASSSSVYGARGGGDLGAVSAFREDDPCLTPASPYAASKRMGELLASTYRDLYGIGVIALRFFTVYGPRQRPDMAIHKFTAAIAGGRPITLFGDGGSRRDYTFIDDIVAGVVAAIEGVEPGECTIYNLGGERTASLLDLVHTIEDIVGKKAIVEHRPDQPGDVPLTYADVSRAAARFAYRPTTALREGVAKFWDWYRARLP